MPIKYNKGVLSSKYYNISTGAPIDSRFVVELHSDLTGGTIKSLYTGLLVYVIEDSEFYVFTATERLSAAAKKEENWKKIGGSSDVEIVIDGVPESGNGISINKTGDVVRDYISSDYTILSDVFYTSQGLNTYDDTELGEEYIILSNGGDSYIKLFNGDSENWIEMNITDDSLGFSIDDIKVKSNDGTISNYVNGTQLTNGTEVCFGQDVDFTGFTELRSNGSIYTFGEDGSNYDDVDIYRENDVIEVIAYNNGEEVKLLTSLDKLELEDKISEVENKIDNIYTTLMIDPDGDGSEEAATLQDVIISMNSAIKKLEEIDVEYADENDIDDMLGGSDYKETPIITIRSLKYFRDKIIDESKFNVDNSKPLVEIDGEYVELATKDYVDEKLTWINSLD